MAKLPNVGRHDGNKRGTCSKAYIIRRQKRKVHLQWGPVEIVGGGGGKIHWLGAAPRTKVKSFNKIEKAKAFVRKRIRQEIGKGYDLLPGKVRIRRSR